MQKLIRNISLSSQRVSFYPSWFLCLSEQKVVVFPNPTSKASTLGLVEIYHRSVGLPRKKSIQGPHPLLVDASLRAANISRAPWNGLLLPAVFQATLQLSEESPTQTPLAIALLPANPMSTTERPPLRTRRFKKSQKLSWSCIFQLIPITVAQNDWLFWIRELLCFFCPPATAILECEKTSWFLVYHFLGYILAFVWNILAFVPMVGC